MNKLMIIGNLTRDPELRVTGDGKEVCNFTVAVNRHNVKEGQPEADFFRVAAWGQKGNNCKKFLAKGKKVCVIGAVSVRTYTTQAGESRADMEVLADDVEFLSPREQGGFVPADDPDNPWG